MTSNSARIFVILITLAIQACKTEKYYVDDLAKQYFGSFKEGSYWIYEDSTGTVDSTWVVSYRNGISSPKQLAGSVGRKEEFEFIEIELNSSLPFNTDKYFLDRTSEPVTYARYSHNPSPYTIEYLANFQSNTVFYGYSSSHVHELSNYQVNQYLFPKALKVCTDNYPNCDDYIVLVPMIGVVEKKLYGNDTPFKIKNHSVKR